jgi:hypothetical protein
MSGGWVGDLIAEQRRVAEANQRESELEMLRHKRFCDLASVIWRAINDRIRACIVEFNAGIDATEKRLAIRELNSFGVAIFRESRPLDVFSATLNLESGVLRFGPAYPASCQNALVVKIESDAHWSFKDTLTNSIVPLERVDRIILTDFLKSMAR